jgi:hypothetical protein
MSKGGSCSGTLSSAGAGFTARHSRLGPPPDFSGIHRISAASSRLGSIGLVIWSFIPAFRLLSRSPLIAWAVMARIGSLSKRSSARISLVAVNPSMTGIWMSIRTRSNGSAATRSTPSRPFTATVTRIARSPSNSVARSRFTSLSSTSSTRRPASSAGKYPAAGRKSEFG